MQLFRFLRRLAGQKPSSSPRPAARRRHTWLWLEVLENRWLPSGVAIDLWVAAAPGNWSVGTNWSLGYAPTGTVAAVFDPGLPTGTNTASTIDSAYSLSTPRAIQISANYTNTITDNLATLTLTASGATLPDFTQANGTFLLGNNMLTLTAGNLTHTGGTFSAANGTLSFSGVGNQTLTSGGSTIGQLVHTGSGTLTLGDALTVTGNLTNTGGSNGNLALQAAQNFPVGGTPRSVAVGDVNGDGKPDLVVANSGNYTVSVLLGNGNGTFQNQQTFALRSFPYSVAVADVNGDGKPDLVVANRFGNSVSVLLGNGNGTFQAAQNFTVGNAPKSVAVADVNGDGKPDLVVANSGRGGGTTVSVLLGNGNGTFQAAQNFTVGSFPVSVAVADVNGDGKPDLAVANYNSRMVSVLLGNGNGTFQAQQTYAVGVQPISVAVADVNGDGKPDLAVANYGGARVSVLLGNGNGTFQAAQNFPVGSGPYSVAVADVNGDGKPDLAVANFGDGTVSVLLGNGNGTFQAAQNFPVGSFPVSVAVADVNGDGKPDLVVANSGNNTVSVLLNNAPAGNGTLNANSQNLTVTGTTTISGGALLAGSGNLTALGGLTITGGTFSGSTGNVAVGNATVGGNVSLSGTGMLIAPTGSFTVFGNWTKSGGANTTFNNSNATVTFDTHGLRTLTSNGAAFYNLDVKDNPSVAQLQLQDDLTVANNVTIETTGNLTANGHNITFGGSWLVQGSGAFVPTTGTVTFNGNAAQTLDNGASSFNNLAMSGGSAGNLSLTGHPLTVAKNLAIGGGALSAGAQNLTVGGNWTNSATFNAGPSTVTLNGTGQQISGNTTFNNLTKFVTTADMLTFQAGSNQTVANNLILHGASGQLLSLRSTISSTQWIIDPIGSRNVSFVDVQDSTNSAAPTLYAGKSTNSGNNTNWTFINGLPNLWTGPTGGNWSVGVDWSLGHAPTTDEVALFDPSQPGGNNTASTIDSAYSLSTPLAIQVTSSYTQTITDNLASLTLTASGADQPFFTQANGTFLLGNNMLTLTAGNLTHTGGTFSAANGTLSFSGLGNQTLTSGGSTIGQLVHTGSGTLTLGDALTVTGNLTNTGGSNGNLALQAAQNFPVGANPRSVAVGDFNGDGKPDLAVTNGFTSTTVSVLLGNGNGTFQAAQNFPVGSDPSAVAVADVNGDGKPDLAVVNNSNETLSVLLGNGNGTFQAQKTFALGGDPVAVTVADFNGDGKPDLAVVNNLGVTVSVLLGNGNGTFQAAQNIPVGNNPFSVAVADVNGDGKPDLVVGNYGDRTVGVLLGNGNGTFQAAQNFPVGRAYSVAVGDFNGDGKPDLAVANDADGTVSALLGNGNGTFQAAQNFTLGSRPVSVAVADVNGDGKLDLAVANYGDGTVSVLLGNGNGTFQAAQNFPVGSDPSSVTVVDVNGDGQPDFAVTNYNSGTVSVLLNNAAAGNGTLNANGQNLTVAGTTTISGGTLRAGSGTLTLAGLTIQGTGTFAGSTGNVSASDVAFSGNANLTAPTGAFAVSGNWTNGGGNTVFHNSNATVTFGGSGTQNLTSGGAAFYNLSHSGTGTLKQQDNLTVTATLLNSNGTYQNGNANLTVQTLINAAAPGGTGDAIFTLGAGNATVTGAFTNESFGAGNGTFTTGSGAFTLDSTFTNEAFAAGNATFTASTGNLVVGGAFFNKNLNGSGSVTVTVSAGNITTTGSLTNEAFTAGNATVTAGGSIGSGGGLFNEPLNGSGSASVTATNGNITTTSDLINEAFTAGNATVTAGGGIGIGGGLFNEPLNGSGSASVTATNGNITTTSDLINKAFTAGNATVTAGGSLGIGGALTNATESGSGSASVTATNGNLTTTGGLTNKAFTAGNATVTASGSLGIGGAVTNEAESNTGSVRVVASAGNITTTGPLVNLTFTAGNATFTAGGSIAIGGSISNEVENGTGNVTVTASAGNITTTGLLLNLTYTAGSATVTAGGSLGIGGTLSNEAVNGTGNVTVTASAGNLTTTGDLLNLTYTVGNATVTASTGNSAIGGNLTDEGTAAGLAAFTAGSTTLTITGGVTIEGTSGIVHGNTALISLTGNWLNEFGGVFDAGNSTVAFTGASPQNVTSGGSAFHTLQVLDPITTTLTLQDPLTATGDIFIGANGTLNANNQSIALAGNWTNQGNFTAGNGTVTFNGTNQSIAGNTTFYNLSKSVTSAATLTFQAGANQTITNNVTLQGASGQLLSLRSSVPGTQWIIDPMGNRTIGFVDVKDSDNTNATGIKPTPGTDSGDNTNWIFIINEVWTGAIDSNWDTAGNWDQNTVPSNIANVQVPVVAHEPVLHSASTTRDLTIQVGANVTLAGQNLTVGGNFTNQGTLILNGTENLTLSQDTTEGTWDYVGDGTGGNITLKDFGVTDYFNLQINDTNGSKDTFRAGADLGIAGNMTVSGGTYDAHGQNTTVNGLTTVTSAAFVDMGVGSTATQTFTGGLALTGGHVGSAANGTLVLGANVTAAADGGNVSSSISGNLPLGSSTRTFTVTADAANGNVGLNVAAAISGSGGISKAGTGTLSLASSNSYTGNTTVGAGVLIAAANGALGTTAGGTVVSANGTLAIGNGVQYGLAEDLQIAGNGANGTAGAFESLGGNDSFAGNVTLTASAAVANPAAGTTLTLGGTVHLAGNNLNVVGPGMVCFGNPIDAAGGSLNFTGDPCGNLTYSSPVGKITINGNLPVGDTITAPGIGDLVVGGNLLGKVNVNGTLGQVDVGGNIAANSISANPIGFLDFGGVVYGNGTVKSALNAGPNDANAVLTPGTTTTPSNGTYPLTLTPGETRAVFLVGSTGFNPNKLLISDESASGPPVMANIMVVQSGGNPVIPEIDFSGDGGSINTGLLVTNILSTGKLGDITLSAAQGIPGNITAPSIFGSIVSQFGPISGTIQTSGDIGMAMTDVHGNITGVTRIQAPTISGKIITGGNLISSVNASTALSGVIAVQGDVGVIQLSGGNAVVGPGPANLLTRFGNITTGSFTGQAIVLGNVFGDLVFSSLSGRVAVKGHQEYGLPAWRQGILGNVTINGAINKNAGIFSAGLIGDSGALGLGNTTYGTHLNVSGAINGMVGAEGNIDYGGTVSAKYAQFNGRGLAGSPSGATIDWIFTHGGNTPLTIPGDLGTLMADLADVFVSGGNLTHH